MPPTSPESSANQDTGSPAKAAPLVLRIRGVGEIPGFKNRKRIAGQHLITDPKVKQRMQALQRAIECELRSAFQAAGAGTSMVARRRLLTLLLPQDDCWTCIPELILTGELVEPGQEGADITIERLP